MERVQLYRKLNEDVQKATKTHSTNPTASCLLLIEVVNTVYAIINSYEE